MAVKREVRVDSKGKILPVISDKLSQVDLTGMSLMSLLQFGSATLLKEAIAAEITNYLDRGRYQHHSEDQDFMGYRNGYQKTKLDTPMGQIEYDRPKVTNAPGFSSQFHQKFMRRPEEFATAVTDMYVNGVSTRKVKNSLRAVTGKKVRLSKSTVSRITKSLREEFRQWKKRDLSDFRVAYLFLDAIRVGMRVGGTTKDSVLIAYGIMQDGSLEVLGIDLTQSEADKSWGKFVADLKSRGLADPLLACSDGNQGVINAIDGNFPTSYRQRCLKHRSQNILDAVPKEFQDLVQNKLAKIFWGATSLEQAKQYFKDFKKEFSKRFPTAVERLETDLDQCLTFYLFPANHWKRIRTSNKLERLNKEIRRRLDVIGRHPDEIGCLSLIYKVTMNYAKQQLTFKADDLVLKLWARLREEKISMLKQLSLDLFAA